MRVHVETDLPCSVEQAWEAIQSAALLSEVSGPLVPFEAVEPLSVQERWTASRVLRFRTYLFGGIVLGVRTIEVNFIHPEEHVIQTQERDSVVHLWQHRMALRPAPHGQAFYSDIVDIEAGLSTLSVWISAQWLYRHRHRRWLKVMRRLSGENMGGKKVWRHG